MAARKSMSEDRRFKSGPANPAHLLRRGRVYYVRYWVDGQERRLSTGKTSTAAAMAWAVLNVPAERLQRTRRDTRQGYDWRRAMQLDIEQARDRGRSETYIDYDIIARHKLLRFFQGDTHITVERLKAFRDEGRRIGREDESARRAFVVLRRACALLEKVNITIWLPPKAQFPELRTTRIDANLRGTYIDRRYMVPWLAALPPRARAVAVLELTTGLRASEVRRLSPNDLTLTDEYEGVPAFISIIEGVGKDKSGRTMALCEAAYRALCLLWSYPSMTYSPKAAWLRAAQQTGLRARGRAPGRVHERDMRHNFATVNSEHWGDMQGLMKAMGHKGGCADRYQTATPSRLVRFATFSAQYYGLADAPQVTTVHGPTPNKGTLAWASRFSTMLLNPT